MRLDLHVHSKFSRRPSYWFLRKLNCPESWTEPLQLYRIARKMGMSLVTITDHNTIAGALEIAHLPDTFISEEVTTYFPEDKCEVHVLTLNINENQHRDIRKIRKNLFELVDYLNQEQITYVLAHPLFSINERLTLKHFEQLLLLFKNFELNGSRDEQQNRCLQHILSHLEPEDICRLSEKHKISPPFSQPWRKNFVAGSDDHSSLNIARVYTEIEGAHSLSSALGGIENHRAKASGRPSTPLTLAHNLYGIAYQFYRSKFHQERYVHRDILLKFLDQSLKADSGEEATFISRLKNFWSYRKRPGTRIPVLQAPPVDLIQAESRKILKSPSLIKGKDGDARDPEGEWFSFVNQVSSRVLFHLSSSLLGDLSRANVFGVFRTLGAAAGLYTFLGPYLIAFSHLRKDRQLSQTILQRFNGGDEPVKAAHFTDTFYEVNGVAITLQQQVQAAIRNHKKFTVITCDGENRPHQEGVKRFKPVGIYELPEYPEQKLYHPPLLEMLDYCYQQQFTHIHSATPGPMGLAALALARILKLPLSGTYHTALPQYAQFLTEDEVITSLMWKYVLWYYQQMDFIYVSSQSTREELIEKGVGPEKIIIFPRGIDTRRFHPSKRNGYLREQYRIDNGELKLLYVGRVSREKNLPLLAEVFKSLLQSANNAHLIVVGDGPYLRDMQEAMRGTPCTFTGYLKGEELAWVYASSDLFIFPSTTDTFGNVVLEAQASGLPVIVTDRGCPRENMSPGKTGLIVKANDAHSLLEAIQTILAHPQLHREMGRAARQYVEGRSFDKAFLRAWELYSHERITGLAQTVEEEKIRRFEL